VIGLPLIATCARLTCCSAPNASCHLFFEIGDGSALAFFKFANPEDQALFGPKMPASPFHHIALNVDQETQEGIEKRIAVAGYTEPAT